MAFEQIGTCRYCRERRPLRRSHIVPEYLYKPGYDDKHRLVKLEIGSARESVVQKGVRDRLLCDVCEGELNKEYENPALAFFSDGIPLRAAGDIYRVRDFDYETVKLMLLSVLWRAGVSSDEHFRQVDLGETHERRLRSMLRERTPHDDLTYQIWAYLIVDPDSRAPLRGTISSPVCLRKGARRVYWMMFGGCAWFYSVASHPITDIDDFTLAEDGTIRMPVRAATEFGPFHDTMMNAMRRIIDRK